MANLRKEIMNIAMEREKRRERGECVDSVDEVYEAREAMDEFFSLAELGANAYNEGSGKRVISAYRLTGELLTLFLNLPGKRAGFCIIGPERFAVFLDEVPNGILVLGQKKQPPGGTGGQILTKARQLIRITCLRSENGFIFKDNTGADIDKEDIIKHIINWVSE
ncbi:MAG: hypothetical protein C4291_09755 [Candidatus Dadabacteria bacterium]